MANILPFALWIAVALLLVRIAHSEEFAPCLSLMCSIAWVRCSLWLAHSMYAQNQLAIAYPWFQLFAAVEAIILSGWLLPDALRVMRMWAAGCVGVVLGSLAWGLYPGGVLSVRVSVQVAALGALLMAGLFSWRYRLRSASMRGMWLAVILAGSVLSTRPGGGNYTVATEIIHLCAFLALIRTFPLTPRKLLSFRP